MSLSLGTFRRTLVFSNDFSHRHLCQNPPVLSRWSFKELIIFWNVDMYKTFLGIRTFVWWYNIDSLLEGGLTWSRGGYGSPAEKPDVPTSAPPNKATIPATPYKAPKPINPLISAMNHFFPF